MILAPITVQGAQDVADYLDRTIETHCPTPNRKEWEEVRDALYAIANDTDAIVTEANFPVGHKLMLAFYQNSHGEEHRLFATKASAEAWRREIAAENWDAYYEYTEHQHTKPTDPELLADEYFALRENRDEYFEADWIEVE